MSRRGRPTTHPLDRLRTRIWLQAIKTRSGLGSAYAVEMALDGDRVRSRASDVARPRKFDGYEKGSKVPNDVPGPRNAVEQAEAAFSGTARWFRSPIWRALRKELNERWLIERALRQLEPDVTAVLLEAAPRGDEKEPRMRPIDASSAQQLLALGSFDALVAAVLLAELAEAISSPDLRKIALGLYVDLQPQLRKLPELGPHCQDLFSAIDAALKHWVYLSANQRMDVVIFSEGIPTAAREWGNTVAAKEEAAPADKPIVITISRDYGSGGDELAFALARRLKIKLTDHLVLDPMAARLQAPETERAPSEADWLSRWQQGEGSIPHEYVIALKSAVRTIARKGSVILGRGAHLALQHEATLRLRVVGSVSRCAARYNDTEASVRLINSRRARFVWDTYKRQAADSSEFDLVICTDRIDDFDALADSLVTTYVG